MTSITERLKLQFRIASVGYDEWRKAWRDTIDTNLIGTANLTFCAAHQMIKQRQTGEQNFTDI